MMECATRIGATLTLLLACASPEVAGSTAGGTADSELGSTTLEPIGDTGDGGGEASESGDPPLPLISGPGLFRGYGIAVGALISTGYTGLPPLATTSVPWPDERRFGIDLAYESSADEGEFVPYSPYATLIDKAPTPPGDTTHAQLAMLEDGSILAVGVDSSEQVWRWAPE